MISNPECPEKSKLVDYLLGKLPAPETQTCEGHIAQCDLCEETIRGLNINDTLDELTREALSDDHPQSDSEVVQQLLGAVREIPKSNCQGHDRFTLERSSEITRHLTPSENSGDIGRIGHYRITDLLGAGSTGVVYQAIDEKLDREVALKILRPSLGSVAQNRFLAEAKSAAAVDHENVITIYEVGEDDKLAFMAMQLLPGETLDARLQREAILGEQTTRSIASDIAAGLAAAHEKDLIHRDIKPANIWLTRDDRAKILDFGLARVVDDDPGFTSTGMIAGTPSYMSPEQSKGNALDGRSDLFSLGCIIYRASTGRQPFGATNVLATLQSIQSSDPVPPADTAASVSQELSDLTMCLLEKLPANRPASAVDVVAALKQPKREWAFPVGEYHRNQKLASVQPLTKLTTTKPKTQSGIGWFGQVATLLFLCALAGGGFLFGDDIIKIITGYGELTIETDDPNVKIELLENGKKVRIIDTMTDKKIDIKEGKYTLQVAGEENSVQVTPTDLTISRGGKEIVRVNSSPAAKLNEPASTPTENGAVAVVQPEPNVVMSLEAEDGYARRREEFAKRIAYLESSLPDSQREASYELASAKLEQLEFEIAVCFQFGEKLSQPQEIAEAHSLLQQQIELLKRQNIALLPELSESEDGSDGGKKYRLLKTKRSMAYGKLYKFETFHSLPNSQPRFGGSTLIGHMAVIETERDADALANAYLGVVNLSDQFGTREEFFDTVKNLVVDHGGKIRVGKRSTFRSAIEKGISKLTGEEIQFLITKFLVREGNKSTMNTLGTLFQLRGLRSSFEKAFADPDDLFQAILESKESSPWSLVSIIMTYSKLSPKNEKLKESVIALAVESARENSDATASVEAKVVFKVDSESVFLVDLLRQTYDTGRKLDMASAFEIFELLNPDSDPAIQSIPLLVEALHSLNRDRITWNDWSLIKSDAAALVLAGYARSRAAAKKIASELLPFVEKGLAKESVKRVLDAARSLTIEPASELLELQKVVDEKAKKLREAKRLTTEVYEVKHLSELSLAGVIDSFREGSTARVAFDSTNGGMIVTGTKQDHDLLRAILKTTDQKPKEDE